MLKFYYNGIKENGGKLQKAFYSMGGDIGLTGGTITIYAREYTRFSEGVRKEFTVENNSDAMTDYFEEDKIRVASNHEHYPEVLAAFEKAEAKNAARRAKYL